MHFLCSASKYFFQNWDKWR